MEASMGMSWGLFHRQYILVWKLYIHSSGRATEAGWDRSWIVRYLLYFYHGANEIETVYYVFTEVPFVEGDA